MGIKDRITKINQDAEEQIQKIKDRAQRDILTAQGAAARRIELAKANEEARAKAEELRARLERAYGMENHPKRDMLWNKAWEHGHSSGLSEVENWYDDLAELVK